jgi:hypothetical protein
MDLSQRPGMWQQTVIEEASRIWRFSKKKGKRASYCRVEERFLFPTKWFTVGSIDCHFPSLLALFDNKRRLMVSHRLSNNNWGTSWNFIKRGKNSVPLEVNRLLNNSFFINNRKVISVQKCKVKTQQCGVVEICMGKGFFLNYYTTW